MAKTRIHAIAKELNVASKDIVNYLTTRGIEVTSHSSSIDDEAVVLLRKKFGGSQTASSTPAASAEKKAPAPAGAPAGREAAADSAADNAKVKRPRPKKKKIAVVFNSQNTKASGGGPARTGDGTGRRSTGERRPQRSTDPRRGGFRPESGNRVIRPRPENERTIRPEATKPRPVEEEVIVPKPVPEVVKPAEAVKDTPVAPDTKEAPKPVETAPAVVQKETPSPVKSSGTNTTEEVSKERKSGGGRGGDNNRSSNNGSKNTNRQSGEGHKGGKHGSSKDSSNMEASSKNGGNEKKGSNGRDSGKNKKRNQEHDALGSKKKERYGNLEKNSAKKKPKGNQMKMESRNEDEILTLILPEHLTIRELADKMKVAPSAVVKKLFMKGQMVTVNQDVDFEQAEEIAMEFNCICEPEEKVDVIAELLKEDDDDPKKMVSRPPVVCVMGHVDHGKTSLLDAIRDTRVQAKEAGGITQKIGAYVVSINGQDITFLDTPGHEAFTAMRMRGANSTDIAILVVAADDGVMPQTVEAINHAKAAGIEIIVAINKIDKPNANIERVKQELSEYELIPEDWGGSTIFVPVSAHTHEGIESLLEMILLTAEVLELKANPKRNARGLVIEAELDKGRGAVATILVQKGTLKVGDPVAAGSAFGRVRAMIDDNGKNVKSAGPSMPVEILGLSEVPNAGEIFVALDSEKEARSFANTFVSEGKNRMIEDSRMKMSLDDLFSQIQAGNLKELDIIVKADVQGSVEAVRQSLEKLSNEEVIVKVIHGGVGAINESDVTLASASNAIIIGFNVRPDPIAKQTADQEGVDIRLYKVIYNAIEDVEAAMKGMLEPIFEEKVIGHAEVRQIFKASGVGNIAGSYILDGTFQRDCKVRITRGDEQIYEGSLASLKRFKDDVKEVRSGYECGLVFDGFDAIQEEDRIEAYIMVEVAR